MATVYLLLGGNLGSSFDYIKSATKAIADEVGQVTALSSYYETEPWGFEHEQNFINQIVVIETSLSPQDALQKVLSIEHQLGRERKSSGYEGRVIDIDILFYDDLKINDPNLIVPHPHIQDRMFALIPLKEVSPDYVHPVFQETISELTLKCKDKNEVKKVSVHD